MEEKSRCGSNFDTCQWNSGRQRFEHTVASGIGRPLYPDAITRACTRLDFARVCGCESACKVDVEYEWLPPKCKQCVSLGHSTATCPESNKIEKPKVAVYVCTEAAGAAPPTVSKPMAKDAVRTVQHTVPEEDGTVDMEIGTDERSYIDKGKAPLAKCDIMNVAFWNVRGLNRRDHQVAVKELVNEFRLNFLGLLETRVSAVNVLRVQTFLPRWSWFTDYDMPGNHIWIAWDDDLLDVDVLNLDVQFIHCRISIRCAHLSVLATVVYGANDSVSRRGLWQSLVTLADSISDEPWIVGGDFNTVVDMSEVCGASADIHLAMNEFRDLKEIVAYENVWIDCWLMMLGYDCGQIRIINLLTLGLPITPHLCSEEILIIIRIEGTSMYAVTRKLRALKPVFRTLRKKKGDLSVNVKLAAEFLATVQQLLQIDRHNTLLLCLEKCCKLVFFKATKLEQAPGPDGYSSGFYKAAWPVIGEEMIKAILEFFTTGLPMRCALKVDLRKAYDTVEWDFLSAVLQMFGFPGTFIGWVEECVTTPMFSVCINGNPHGFFKGSRGLRQGDPMSPFLFVLIMEMTSSSFCKADVASVRVFRHGLAEFAKLSGLHANPQKSQLILSRSAQDVREQLLAALHFQEGHLPLRMGKHSVVLCGRIQLIKSVLMSLNVYWAMAFILPQGVIREVEKKMRTFLWKGNSAVGYPKVAWNVVCKPIEEGGQGIRDILALNKALMSRHLWNVIQNNQSSIWVKWIAHTRLRHKSVWTVDVKGGSWGWRKILQLRSALLPYIEFKICDGESFSLWHDPWHSLGSLITRFSRGPGRTNIPEAAKLSRGGVCVLCGREMETHEHLFFRCNYSRQCIRILKGTVRFTWPNRAWAVDIAWASKRWNGRHIMQAAYRALLAAIVYHIWQERHRRVFQQSMRPSSTIARIVVDEMRQKIISVDLPDSVSSRGLYRLWQIPWPVRGTA
ncbi:putative ribonuclease H protein [Sesamum angolense]|uniref:Ribonuclease H protein n=1 Tax=Sesamum angolense TaxID=2727404 RepID=A0AAE1T9N7_9LAMI|nr:putative ribonuclease H protein [Sesamum angolense]